MFSQIISSKEDQSAILIANFKLKHDLILLQQLIALLILIDQEAVLTKVPPTAVSLYPEAVKLFNSFSIKELLSLDEFDFTSITQTFADTNFVLGLERLTDYPNAFTKITENKRTVLVAALCHPDKSVLHWLRGYLKNNNAYLYSNEIQKAIVNSNTEQLVRLLTKQKRPLPKQSFPQQETYGLTSEDSDLLEDACLTGDVNVVKILCEFEHGKFISQFDFKTALHASTKCNNSEVFFYLLNFQLQRKEINAVLSQLFNMISNSYRYTASDSTRWYFRKEWVEELIPFLLRPSPLTENEKSILLKIPVIYLLTDYIYNSQAEFDSLFNAAFTLLEKNLPLPGSVQAYIEKPDIQLTPIVSITYNPKHPERSKQLHPHTTKTIQKAVPKIERMLLVSIGQFIKDCIKKQQIDARHLYSNIMHRHSLTASQLFDVQELQELKTSVEKNNHYFLFDYLSLTMQAFSLTLSSENTIAEILENAKIAVKQVDYLFLRRGTIEHPYWGVGSEGYIQCLIQIAMIFNKTHLAVQGENPLQEKQLQGIYLYLTKLVSALFSKKGLFVTQYHVEHITQLLEQFNALGRALKLSQFTPVMDVLPFLLFYNSPDKNIHYLQNALIKSTHEKNLLCHQPILTLALLNMHIMHRLNIQFDATQCSAWFIACQVPEQLFRITVHPFLGKQNSISLTNDNIKNLIADIQAIHLDNLLIDDLKYDEKDLYCHYLNCKLLFHWAQHLSLPEDGLINEKIQLLKLKAFLLIKLQIFSKQVEVVSKKEKNPSLIKHVEKLLHDLSLGINNIKREIKHAYRPQVDIVYKGRVITESPFKIAGPLYTLYRHTRLHPRDFQEKPEDYARIRGNEALDLSPNMLTGMMEYCCIEIANMMKEMQTYFVKLDNSIQATQAKQQSLFYRNHYNSDDANYNNIFKTYHKICRTYQDMLALVKCQSTFASDFNDMIENTSIKLSH